MTESKLKSEILCTGLRVTENAKRQIMVDCKYILDPEYAHGAYIIFPDGSCTNAALAEKFSESALNEVDYDGSFFITDSTKRRFEISILEPPRWYDLITPSGKKFCDIFQLHGVNTLFCKVFQPCDYYESDKGCLFCKFPKARELKSEDYEDVEFVLKNISKEALVKGYHIALSGGTRLNKIVEYNNINRVLEAIQKGCKGVPVSLEIAPPLKYQQIELLNSSLVSSVITNIELCDSEVRKIFLPAKSSLSVDHYIGFLEHCVNIWGKYNVGSVLIFGVENYKMTQDCVDLLLSKYIVPTIIPLRPYSNTKLKNFKITNSDDYHAFSKKVNDKLKQLSIKRLDLYGCLRCGGCSLELDNSVA